MHVCVHAHESNSCLTAWLLKEQPCMLLRKVCLAPTFSKGNKITTIYATLFFNLRNDVI